MRVQNGLDRFHLVTGVVDRLPRLGARGGYVKQMLQEVLIAHGQYTDPHGQDKSEFPDWTCGAIA